MSNRLDYDGSRPKEPLTRPGIRNQSREIFLYCHISVHPKAATRVGDDATPHVTGEVAGEVTGEVLRLLGILKGVALGRIYLQHSLKLKGQANFRDRYLRPALKARLIKMTIPSKPNSRL